MKGLSYLVAGFVVSLVVGCSGAQSEEDVDQGAVIGGEVATRCGPPTAPKGAREQSRCVEPSDLDTARSFVVIEPTESGEGFTFGVTVDVRGSRQVFVFADKPYASEKDAQKGAAALLRAGLDAKNFKRAQEAGGQYLTISGANNVVLARTTYVKDGDVKRVTNSVRKALASADLSGLMSEYRGAWRADYRARTFSLVAGNGKVVLQSPRVDGDDGAFNDAIFGTHEIGAADRAATLRSPAGTICRAMGENGIEAWISDSFVLTAETTGYRYHIAQLVPGAGDTKKLASSATTFTTCEGAIEGIQTVTGILANMPRG